MIVNEYGLLMVIVNGDMCVCVCVFQVNISLIVNDEEAEQCVRALHSAFFETDP